MSVYLWECLWLSLTWNKPKEDKSQHLGWQMQNKGFIPNWKCFFACRRTLAVPLAAEERQKLRKAPATPQGLSSRPQPGWDAAAEMFVYQTPQLCSSGSAAWAHGQVLPLTHPRDSCSLWGASRGKAFPPVLNNNSIFSTSLTIAAATDSLEAGKWKTKQTKTKNQISLINAASSCHIQHQVRHNSHNF